MLRRYLDHQRQPKQLLMLPFRIVALAALAYLVLRGAQADDARLALYVGLAMVFAVSLIDAAWWVTHRNA